MTNLKMIDVNIKPSPSVLRQRIWEFFIRSTQDSMLRIHERLSVIIFLSTSKSQHILCSFVPHAMSLTPEVVRDSHTPPTVRGMCMRIGLSLRDGCYLCGATSKRWIFRWNNEKCKASYQVDRWYGRRQNISLPDNVPSKDSEPITPAIIDNLAHVITNQITLNPSIAAFIIISISELVMSTLDFRALTNVRNWAQSAAWRWLVMVPLSSIITQYIN